MKKRILTMAVAFMVMTSAFSQRIADIRIEASFITDKMITELGLSNSLRNSILQVNLNYLGGINGYNDIRSNGWKNRNKHLKKMLTASQWKRYKEASYFYSPISWSNGGYVHNIYKKYPRQEGRKQFRGPDGGERYGTPPPPPPPNDKHFDKKPPRGKKGPKEWERGPGRR